MDTKKKLALQHFATRIRLETVKQVAKRGFGHLPGSLSVVDALSVLYGDVMNIDPKNPQCKDRDIMVMSKGHAGPAVYSTLALKGYFPMDWLNTLNQPGTKLPSHCDRLLTPGIDMTAGSLGQGFSAALGMALAVQVDKKDNKTYVFVGDGEMNEGQVWEALLFGAQHKLSEVTLFVDRNLKQLDGDTEEILGLGDVAEKIKTFGWHTQTIDGHDVEAIYDAIDLAHKEKDRPSCIVMNTIKGKGIPSIEQEKLNHHIVFTEEQAVPAVEALTQQLNELEAELKNLNANIIETA